MCAEVGGVNRIEPIGYCMDCDYYSERYEEPCRVLRRGVT